MFLVLTISASLGASLSRDARVLHDDGLALLRRRQAPREQLEALEREHPAASYTSLLRGHCALLLQGDAAKAEAHYGDAASSCDDEDEEGRTDVEWSFGRLYRQQQRWEEADAHYLMAFKLRPMRTGLVEERAFVMGKRQLVVDGAMSDALLTFERGLSIANEMWRPHFAREAAHCRGLCGDAAMARTHYETALELGAIRDRASIGELMSALAAHHERNHDLVTASDFLSGAKDAFFAQTATTTGTDASAAAAAAAAAHLRHAQVIEALYALGERDRNVTSGTTVSNARTNEGAADGDDLPAELAAAATSYRAAIGLKDDLVAAYDNLAFLLSGTSRLTNFGAAHAAALNTAASSELLMRAKVLAARRPSTAAGGERAAEEEELAAADERREAQLEAAQRTAEEVAAWEDIAAALPPTAEGASTHARGGSAPAAVAAWRLPASLASRAEELPRRTASSVEDLMALVAAREPVVLTNLQADAGFASADAWTAGALSRLAGDRIVKVSVSPSGRFDGAEDGGLWGMPGDEVLVRPPETHMRLADLLTLLRAPTAETFYLEYNALHQYLGGVMRALVPTPPQAAGLRPLLTNLWLGKGATVSPLHYDEYENLLAQVRGTKELLLFPPEDYPHLEYVARPKGHLRYEWPNSFTREPIDAAARATRVIFAASINLTHPSAAQQAALDQCRPLRCTLREGETLLLPAYWHHEVFSHAAPPSTSEPAAGEQERLQEQHLNVAVNFWFRNETAPPACFDAPSTPHD